VASDRDRSNIVLTGFMGTGKSTVGRVLARRLGRRFVDTDTLIEREHGPIADIFAHEGEPAFRRHEQEVARRLARRNGLVIATGGRLMLDPVNAERLGASGHVFALTADAEEILSRVLSPHGPVRPLLAGDDPAERVRSLLAERTPMYARFPSVETGGRTPAEIADEIIDRLESARDQL
jgi:shikimate kinase